MRPSPIGGDAVLKATDISATTTGGEVASRVQMQLTGPADVKAAHAYFQPTGAEAHLPAVSGLAGADTSAVHVAGQMATKLTEGTTIAMASKATEGAALSMASKAGEGAAMSAAHQAGAQAISPMIQMIMRMPGHLGLMTSFFEALGHFFLGQDILNGLSETAHLLTQHAEGAMHAISSAAEHMGVNIELFPQDGDSILNGMTAATGETHGALLTANNEFASTLSKANVLDTNNMAQVGHNALNASGYTDLTQGQFGHSISSSMNDGSQPPVEGTDKFLAWDTGSAAFRPTLSGVQQPLTNVQMPQTTPTTTPTTTDPSVAEQHAQHASTGHEGARAHHEVAKSAHHAGGRGRLLDADHGAGHEAAREHGGEQTQEQSQSDATSETTTSDATQGGSDAGTADGAHGDAPTHEYTVQHGDNLWDIARTHLGDANRWTEIYHLNQDLLGDNPALIHAGTTLHLPGSDSIASADYVVKPGDNLWDISESHMGGGPNWPEVYHANESVIGSNPSLIHPGQHLTISSDGAGQHLASASGGAHAHSISHAAGAGTPHAHHVLAQGHQHVSTASAPTHHLAQAAPSHQVAESLPTHSVEHAPSVASAESAPTSAPSVGMHAHAGSLASLQPSAAANPALKFENLSAE